MQLKMKDNNKNIYQGFDLPQRRFIGNKSKLMPWIRSKIRKYTKGNSFFDAFGGTGSVTEAMLDDYDTFYLNDILDSNSVIYYAFFGNDSYDMNKLLKYRKRFNNISGRWLDDSYFSHNFGGRYFSFHDAEIIGEIREEINISDDLNLREKDILLSSLLYSSDRIANTVGHYDSYIHKNHIPDRFHFDLIHPINISHKNIHIEHEDANFLALQIHSDITFLDPPYSSRQYCRFYHVLETLTDWDKPDLYGVARKPDSKKNMSEYCRMSAPFMYYGLTHSLHTNYIVTTYNNNFNATKSHSSRNKITYNQILNSLKGVGDTKVFHHPYPYFNSGNTEAKNHQELLFITKVRK